MLHKHIHVHVCTCTCTYMYMYMYTSLCRQCLRCYRNLCTCKCTLSNIIAGVTNLCTCTCKDVYIHVHVHVHVYVYVHTSPLCTEWAMFGVCSNVCVVYRGLLNPHKAYAYFCLDDLALRLVWFVCVVPARPLLMGEVALFPWGCIYSVYTL